MSEKEKTNKIKEFFFKIYSSFMNWYRTSWLQKGLSVFLHYFSYIFWPFNWLTAHPYDKFRYEQQKVFVSIVFLFPLKSKPILFSIIHTIFHSSIFLVLLSKFTPILYTLRLSPLNASAYSFSSICANASFALLSTFNSMIYTYCSVCITMSIRPRVVYLSTST